MSKTAKYTPMWKAEHRAHELHATTYRASGTRKQIRDTPFFQGRDCAVCMSPMTTDENLDKLQCGHIFHENCIGIWLSVRPMCPLCNASAPNTQPFMRNSAALDGAIRGRRQTAPDSAESSSDSDANDTCDICNRRWPGMEGDFAYDLWRPGEECSVLVCNDCYEGDQWQPRMFGEYEEEYEEEYAEDGCVGLVTYLNYEWRILGIA